MALPSDCQPLSSRPTTSSSSSTRNFDPEVFKEICFDVKEVTTTVISSSQSSSLEKQEDTDDIPNGGTIAWLQVLGSFFLWFNTWYTLLKLARYLLLKC